MGLSLLIGYLVGNMFLKNVVARVRPYNLKEGVSLLIPTLSSYSFPSGHTACGFSFVVILFLAKNKWWIPSFVLASLIGFSRLYLYVHFPTDVLCGAICGTVFGGISFYFSKKLLGVLGGRK